MAFERCFARGDWAPIGEYFAEDAIYEIQAPEHERLATIQHGRESVVACFDWIMGAFDRKFEERQLVRIPGPVERVDAVYLHGVAVYRW